MQEKCLNYISISASVLLASAASSVWSCSVIVSSVRDDATQQMCMHYLIPLPQSLLLFSSRVENDFFFFLYHMTCFCLRWSTWRKLPKKRTELWSLAPMPPTCLSGQSVHHSWSGSGIAVTSVFQKFKFSWPREDLTAFSDCISAQLWPAPERAEGPVCWMIVSSLLLLFYRYCKPGVLNSFITMVTIKGLANCVVKWLILHPETWDFFWLKSLFLFL